MRVILNVLLTMLVCLAIVANSSAKEFEWYGIKENVSGGVNLRQGASMDAGIHTCMILNFFYVKPLFKVVAEEGDWLKCKSNRNGIPRYMDFNYFFFYVHKSLLKKIDIEKEGLAILVPADYGYYDGIDVHPKPHIFSYSRWDALPNQWEFVYAAVQMTGKKTGSFIEIKQLYGHGEGSTGYVIAEFFGFDRSGAEKRFSKWKRMTVRDTYLDGDKYTHGIIVREKPSILSGIVKHYYPDKGFVFIIAEQGDFYKTARGKWIFKQCLVEFQPE